MATRFSVKPRPLALQPAPYGARLAGAFLKGMEGKISPARCFTPRRASAQAHDGKTLELVICFECSQFDVYVAPGEMGKRLLVSKAPEPIFDKVLRDAGSLKGK